MRKIKWGIIGTGNIAKQLARAINYSDGAELVAVGSRTIESANTFKDEFQVDRAYGTYEELAEDQEVEVIYIATPHRYHKENAILCIQNNKSVLCEKAFTVNSQEAKEVYELAKKKNVFIMEAMWTKFLPAIQKTLEWIKQDKIGDIRLLKADFCFHNAVNPTSRLFNAELAGGTLLDIGIYPITFATMIYGLSPERIHSSAYIGETNVDEQASYVMDYGNGKQAVLTSSFKVNTPTDGVIYGTRGKIEIPNFFRAEETRLYQDNELVEEFKEPFQVNGYEYEVNEVNQCLLNDQKESNVVPMRDTIRILELMDQIRAEWELQYPFE